jgi:hypothetical protein
VQSLFALHRRTTWLPEQLMPSAVAQLPPWVHATMIGALVQLGGLPPVSGMVPQHTSPLPPQSPGLMHAKPPSIPPELDEEPEPEPELEPPELELLLLTPELDPLLPPELDPLLPPELEPLLLPELPPLEPPELDPLPPLELEPLPPLDGELVPLQPATTIRPAVAAPSAVKRESAVRMWGSSGVRACRDRSAVSVAAVSAPASL